MTRRPVPRIRTVLALAVAAAALLTGAEHADAHHSPLHAETNVGGKVLAIGDSHTWLAGAGAQYPRWDVDSMPGRTSSEGLPILRNKIRGRHETILFDLGTNDFSDPAAFRANLDRLWEIIDGRELVLVTSWAIRNSQIQTGVAAVNDEIRRFAAGHPRRSSVVEWGRTARDNPRLFDPDGVHFTTEGYRLRTQEIRAGVHETAELMAPRKGGRRKGGRR